MINKTLVKNALACKPLDRKPTKEEITAIKAGTLPLPKGLTWRIYNTGRIGIQITFTYKGVSCREIVKDLTHKKSDINYAIARQGEINAEKARGTFKYADYFPESNNLEKFGEAKNLSTVGDYIDRYIDHLKHIGKGKNTITKNNIAKKQVTDLLDILVTDFSKKDLKDHYKKEKRALATCAISFGLLRHALDDAVIDGVIDHNPCLGFKYSAYINKKQKVNNTSNDADPFVLEEVITLLKDVHSMDKHPQLGAMVQLWLNTGLRTHEIFGLQWKYIDLKNKVLYVEEGVIDGVVTKQLKNERAHRQVPLNEAALEALEMQKPLTYFKQGFVFIDDTHDTYKSVHTLRNIWRGISKRTGIRYRRPYNCRHTYATMQISSKNYVNNWELIQWMGHSSVDMLEKHYASFKKAYSEIDSRVGLSLTLLPQSQVQNKCITQ